MVDDAYHGVKDYFYPPPVQPNGFDPPPIIFDPPPSFWKE